MVIDFSKINLQERPKFILRNLDGTAIGVLGHILNPSAKINYMEISELDFEYPAYDNGEKLDEYDLLTSMRIIEVIGYGQFLLQKPTENNDTVSKIKSCKAYSLEYELSNKKITLEEGTYNFWNPLAKESTIMGIVLSELPSWSFELESGSNDLIGKYRTFSADNRIIYDFMQSDLREAYGCIFYFDTKERIIYARSINEKPVTKAVYLSKNNLLHEIEIEENTDDLITVMDVHGADDLDIRSVNPMGTNKIYNLDAYMNESYFSKDIITKWQSWKQNFESYQQTYFNLTVEQAMLISQLATENAVLTDLEGELSGLESKKATLVQAVAIDSSLQGDLITVNAEISAKNVEINNQRNSVIAPIENQITNIVNQLKNINQLTEFSAFFTDDEIAILDRYFKCGSLTDSTFVASNVDSYSTSTTTVRNLSSIFNLINISELITTEYTSDKIFYTIRGGKIETSHESFVLNAEIVRGTLEVNSDSTFVLSLYLNNGTLNNDTTFSGATLSMTGTLNSNVMTTSSSLQFKSITANIYFTRDVTEYQKQSIAMELYEYAQSCLKDWSAPNYYFSVDSVNFLALDDFIEFAKQLKLGDRIYLHIDNIIYEPIVLSVNINFDDLSDFSIEFNEYFRNGQHGADLNQLLEQSISSSNSLDLNQYNYSNFVNSGAKTSVYQFMQSAIDAMKNNILAGTNHELKIDGTGLRCMKYDEESGEYSPKQIWMAHNAIMFTEDNWESATIGIGEFTDKNFGTLYGIVLPALVGTLLAGQNLIIESEKQDGGIAVFKVDAEGASLHNATFDIYNGSNTQITLNPTSGIAIGTYPLYSENNYTINEQNAKFWVDSAGNIHFKGTLEGANGKFSGELEAATGTFSGALSGATGIFSGSLSVGGPYAFHVDENGNMYIGSNSFYTAPFRIDSAGNLYATSATISGTVTASDIAVSSLTAQRLAQLLQSGYQVYDGSYIANLNADYITTGYLSANRIGAGTLDCGQVFLANGYGGFREGYGSATTSGGGTVTTYGAMMYGGEYPSWMSPTNYVIATTGGVRLNAGSTWFSVWSGGIGGSSPVQDLSDRRSKHDIRTLDDESDSYKKLCRALRPSVFIFNHRRDGKKSFGYIAQDVEYAIQNAGLDPKEFTIVTQPNDLDADSYMLTYSEFTALNTYMIQNLYKEIDELKQKLKNFNAL